MIKVNNMEYDTMLQSPPCGGFCSLLGQGAGPESMRGLVGPDRYGLKELKPEQKETVRKSNLHAIRAAQVAEAFVSLKLPWCHEQPHWREGQPHMHLLDQWQDLLEKDRVCKDSLPQCQYDVMYEKMTDIVTYFPNSDTDFEDQHKVCQHQPVWWRSVPNGRWHFRPHPPIQG